MAKRYGGVSIDSVYWTASDNDSTTAPMYNFGKNGGGLHRQPQPQKQMAVSVRCVRE
jgi:hypothetical protein